MSNERSAGSVKRLTQLGKEAAKKQAQQLVNPRNHIQAVNGQSYKLAAPTSMSGGGGSDIIVDPPPPLTPDITRWPLTIPHNGTVDFAPLSPADDYGGLEIFMNFRRNTEYGTLRLHIFHNGSVVRIALHDMSGDDPGFDFASFAGAIASGVLTLTFAANNDSANDILAWLTINTLPRPT